MYKLSLPSKSGPNCFYPPRSRSDICWYIMFSPIVLEPQYLFWEWFEAEESRDLTRNRHESGELWETEKGCACIKGVWTVKCRRGSTVKLCVCLSACMCVSQSVSQLCCGCLTMAVLSADVLRWHVSFYLIVFCSFSLCFTSLKMTLVGGGQGDSRLQKKNFSCVFRIALWHVWLGFFEEIWTNSI